MPELIILIVFWGSLLGMGFMIFNKITAIKQLPEKYSLITFQTLFSFSQNKISQVNPLKDFSKEIFLQKILSRVRVVNLKVEHHTSKHLQLLRQKAQKNKPSKGDSYWTKIKKKKETSSSHLES